MSHIEKDTKNILLGAIIGAAIGIGAAAVLRGARHHKRGNSLQGVGEVLAHVGEAVKHHLEDPEATLKAIDKKIEKNEDTIVDVLEWAALGLQLWNKFKKGD